MRRSLCIAIFFSPAILCATYFANPGLPALETDGLVKSPPSKVCLRAGYMADAIYSQRYKDEFTFPGIYNPSSETSVSTSAATITLNIENRVDINVLLGSSQFQIDRDVYTKRQFAWGLGSKILVYKSSSVFVGLDLKYLESQQKPLFFVAEGYPYNVVSDFKLNYTEMQAALGAAYKVNILSPYVYLSYLYSKIDPTPLTVAVQVPFFDMVVDTVSRSVITKRRWGMAVGATLLGGKKGSITVESRFFNQNAINVSGEIRF